MAFDEYTDEEQTAVKPVQQDEKGETQPDSTGDEDDAESDSSGLNPPKGTLMFFGEEYTPQDFAERVEAMLEESLSMASNADNGEEIAELRETVEGIEERVEDIEFTLEVLATESELLYGECPDCGGELREAGLLSNAGVECTECERSIAL